MYNLRIYTQCGDIVKGDTLHKLLGMGTKTRNIDYKLINSYATSGVNYFLVDELSMLQCCMWNMLSHIKEQCGFILIGVVDLGQLPAIEGEGYIEFDQTWVVKRIFSTRWYELTEPHRSTDPILNKYAKKARMGQTIDYTHSSNEEHDLALCHTIDMEDINE